MSKTTLIIEGMMCEHCSATVKEALLAVPGVNSVEINLKKGNAVVLHDNVSGEDLAMAVINAGFKAKVKKGLF